MAVGAHTADPSQALLGYCEGPRAPVNPNALHSGVASPARAAPHAPATGHTAPVAA
eukprot:CAMPEP_0197908944 /NCGR_PEP_ID=MMETSP1439-20131203/67837_1 /TAXON_ID=66791 /ORGANISM="Gonyaulax spinifera, Strain CCMP409" /LENGTH=55 /DNA_ID=CAMNT_0043530481 /DNA_START=49 /DNA_END=212 /DNA_ORIENTATION=+